MLVIKYAKVLTPERILANTIGLANTTVIIDGTRIANIADGDTGSIPQFARIVDASNLLLVPGFIDLQLNGAFGHDFTAAPATIWEVSARLGQFGTTSYLPTIITSPIANINEARRVLLEERPSAFQGAEPLGLHIEGPFLNPAKKGAHNPAHILPPDDSLIEAWSPAGAVRLVTLAPEMSGANALIEELASRGLIVSAGHSLASYEEAMAGISAGICYGTHLFNAMTPIDHRQPGLPIALLNTPGITVGLIADGIHVHPGLIKLIWAMKGSAGLNLVSDAMAALGRTPGNYLLNEFQVTVTETDCRLADGTLAGSILPLDQALRNLISFTGCSLPEALATVTSTPARLLGIDHERGRITEGAIADMLLLTPDLQVHTTIAAGKVIYER